MNRQQIIRQSAKKTAAQTTAQRPKQAPKTTIPFPDEQRQFERITGALRARLASATEDVQRLDNEYRTMKRYMAENRGEIDPHEMFQNELGLKQIDGSGAFAVDVQERLQKILASPYFARIDFRPAQSHEAAVFYIGRFAFSHEGQLLISDWRSPLAGMFYDYEPGPATYTAPAGRVEGELTRKRQFSIQNGKLDYVLESAVHIQDSILQRELAHTADEKMKSIIATIQKEQNQIIRNENAGTLLIQGVAGSGKTSIALHRVAFLLYRFRGRLSAQNVAILSPNKVFGDYIAGVLPELGEEPIAQRSLAEIAQQQLQGVIGFEADTNDTDSDAPVNNNEAWAQRVRAKSTLGFAQQLSAFIAQLPSTVFAPCDCNFGPFGITAEKLRERFLAYNKHPVKRRLHLLAEELYERFCAGSFLEEERPKKKAIVKALQAMLCAKSSLELYKAFYRQRGQEALFVQPAKKMLEWADVYPFLAVHAAFEGLREGEAAIKHLLVDEMQDYTPVQHLVLQRLFPCPKTILGDFGQNIHPLHTHTLSDIQQLYPNASCVDLRKSYRCSYEIISFAAQIQPGGIEAMQRHGEAPRVLACHNAHNELAQLQKEIAAFEKSRYASLGILAKTNADAKRLYALLSPRCKLQLITPESTRFAHGVLLMSIPMAKGLEFDEVILPEVNREHYVTEHDRSLLYIACTRALHRLSLLYTGEVSPLLP